MKINRRSVGLGLALFGAVAASVLLPAGSASAAATPTGKFTAACASAGQVKFSFVGTGFNAGQDYYLYPVNQPSNANDAVADASGGLSVSATFVPNSSSVPLEITTENVDTVKIGPVSVTVPDCSNPPFSSISPKLAINCSTNTVSGTITVTGIHSTNGQNNSKGFYEGGLGLFKKGTTTNALDGEMSNAEGDATFTVSFKTTHTAKSIGLEIHSSNLDSGVDIPFTAAWKGCGVGAVTATATPNCTTRTLSGAVTATGIVSTSGSNNSAGFYEGLLFLYRGDTQLTNADSNATGDVTFSYSFKIATTAKSATLEIDSPTAGDGVALPVHLSWKACSATSGGGSAHVEPPVGPSTPLADTGVAAGSQVGWGLTLVLVGGLLVLVGQRRYQAVHRH